MKTAGAKWISKIGQAWVDKNPKAVPPLFANKFNYYETPFDKPLTSGKDLLTLWQEVPATQENVTFEFEILADTGILTLAHFSAAFIRLPTGKKAHLDGIFSVKLNNNNLCTEFRWWWNSKEG